MSERYSVIFSGRVREGETPDAVKTRLAGLFHVQPKQLEPLFAKAPYVLRRGLDEATAAKWVAAIDKAGGLSWAEPDRAEPPSPPKPVPVAAPRPAPSAVRKPPVSSLPPDPAVVCVAAPIVEPAWQRKTSELVPFPKCPRCGRLAESIEDYLMQAGVCPRCGLSIRKHAQSLAFAEDGFWSRFDSGEEVGRHWAAFWQSDLWASYWRAAWYLCCALATAPALVRAVGLYSDEGATPGVPQMAAAGIELAALGWLIAIAGFYCFALYRSSRRVFLIHVACSAGLCAVLGVVGAALSFLAEAVGSLARLLRIGEGINPMRAAGAAAVTFLGLVLYFAFVRLPAEKRLAEYLDGPEYRASVSSTVALAGSEFPSGSRGDKYRYYRYVYVKPARAVDSEFDRVLARLLSDFRPGSFRNQHEPQVSLLVFNAIAFRDELAEDRLISADTQLKLGQMASEWGQSRQQSAVRLVRALDTRSPVGPNDLRPLAEKDR